MQVLEKNPMTVRKISENIGVEITGIDLSKPVDAATKKQLHDLVIENVAMVIRDQHLTPEQFQEAAKVFGELMDQDHPKYSFPGMPSIKRHSSFNVAADGEQVKEGLHWHTDGTYRLNPPKFTILYAVELPSSGGNTNVVNMRAAYRALPEELRKKLETMQTANVRLAPKARDRYNANNVAIMAAGGQVPNIHPLVRTNDDNGEKGLWFNPSTGGLHRRHGPGVDAGFPARPDGQDDPAAVHLFPQVEGRRHPACGTTGSPCTRSTSTTTAASTACTTTP